MPQKSLWQSANARTAREEFRAPSHDEPLRKNRSWSLTRLCVVVFGASFILFAFGLSLILLLMFLGGRLNDLSVPFGGEVVHVARSLAAKGTFADPFYTRTGPTAHVAPVYPYLYSLVLRALGTGYAALVVLWACNVGLLALQMALAAVGAILSPRTRRASWV